MGLPKIHEVGRVSGEIELRFTAGGKAVCQVPLVFSKRKKNESTGAWEDNGVLWVRGTAWEQFAENIVESLSKGDEVIVSGELSQREYERKDGTKGSSLELALYAIGPNLKTATAKVNRVKRSAGDGGFGGGSSTVVDDPWGSAPPSGGGFADEVPF